jgi:hypothetical protein
MANFKNNPHNLLRDLHLACVQFLIPLLRPKDILLDP